MDYKTELNKLLDNILSIQFSEFTETVYAVALKHKVDTKQVMKDILELHSARQIAFYKQDRDLEDHIAWERSH